MCCALCLAVMLEDGPLQIGSLEDLRMACKGGEDPDGKLGHYAQISKQIYILSVATARKLLV